MWFDQYGKGISSVKLHISKVLLETGNILAWHTSVDFLGSIKHIL